MSDLPDYFENFEPNRVPQGSVVPTHEMVRRLAHYLHVPQRFGTRLLKAFEHVMSDALMHGEGIRIKNAGHLTLRKLKGTHVTMFGEQVERKYYYKYKWHVSKDAKEYLEYITNLEKEGLLDDKLFSTENPKF